MATGSLLNTSEPRVPPPLGLSSTAASLISQKFLCVSFPRVKSQRQAQTCRLKLCRFTSSPQFAIRRIPKLSPLASYGETTETQQEVEEKEADGVQDSEPQDNPDVVNGVEDVASEGESVDAQEPNSVITAALQSYKEALTSNDEPKVTEIESYFSSIEDEKIDLERNIASLSEELSYEKARILRISADFDNFRKRTERERLSLVTNAQGEVVENLLPVLDNFERAKSQLKVETEGEEKINNSYQSIYKQFVEILGSLGVVPVETIGNPFDPLFHEAIMREDSTEFEEGIILQEFRKGFKLGDRLLRPSMVKVSAGPGPAKPEKVDVSEEPEAVGETNDDSSSEPDSTGA